MRYVLSVTDRDDRNCEHNSEVVGVYSNLNYALKEFKRLCATRTEKGDEIELFETRKGYCFISTSGKYENYKCSIVELTKFETINIECKEELSLDKIETFLHNKSERLLA